MFPFFSIIVPIYNAEKYIVRLVSCILQQPFQNWELILVDDGSNDASFQLCESFSSKDARITVIHQQNAGPSVARNHGLDVAKGDYISFLDADDWFEPELYNEYVKHIEEKHYDVVFQGFVDECPDGHTKFNIVESSIGEKKEDIIYNLYKKRCFGWAWNKVFRKEIIDKNHLRFDESIRLWEDELFTIEFLCCSTTIKSIGCHYYHYMVNENSLMHNPPNYVVKLKTIERLYAGLYQLGNEELRYFLQTNYKKEFKTTMLMSCLDKAGYECSNAEKINMLRHYLAMVKIHPEIKKINVLRNKFSYLISELLLASRCPPFILSIFKIL